MKNKFMRNWAFINIGMFIFLLFFEIYKPDEKVTRILAITCFASLLVFCIVTVIVNKNTGKNNS